MFIGSPPGNYDRILDFSTAVTGSLFFVPAQTMLDGLADDAGAGDNGDEDEQRPRPPAGDTQHDPSATAAHRPHATAH